MGCVYAAVHKSTGEEVALKLLSRETAENPQNIGRVLQEGRALTALRHRGIVRVSACERLEDGTVYLAMERLPGVSLSKWKELRGGRVKPSEAIEIGSQIADAMTEVHDKGIVHRDLKPDNIIVLSSGAASPEDLAVKVLDFGIAKVPPAESADTQVQTADHTFLGTTPYMAPEQCLSSASATAKSDVYALGVLLVEILAGRLPFDAREDAELIAMHVKVEPPFLRDLAPEAPEGLGVLIASMLAKDPKERPTMRRCCIRLAELQTSERETCPLPGLQPFTDAQAELFFGRQTDINVLSEQLHKARDTERRWVLIEGPSGAGKSSLVQAGVRPRLEEERGPDGPRWLVACMRPSDAPLRALAQALVDALSGHGLEQTADEVLTALSEAPNALCSLAAHTPRGCTLLLVIEQMEELFTLGTDENEEQRAFFDAQLHAALLDRACPLRLLTTLRSDLQRLAQIPKLESLLNTAVYRHYLGPMDQEALQQVVRGMAQRAGLRVEGALAGRMVRDAAGTDCPLPLLGHALRALWSPRESSPASLEERYEQMGRVGGALAKQAESFLEKLGDERRERAKWMILALVQVARGGVVTRRSRALEEVLAAGGGGERAEEVLGRLSGARLDSWAEGAGELRLVVLSSEPGQDPSRQRVDLIHETLLLEVPLIERWIDRERLRLEQYADLENAAAAWEQARHPRSGLPSGALLAHYRGGLEDERRLELLGRMVSEPARRFLKRAEYAERWLRWIKRAVTAALIIAVFATSISACYAMEQRQIAEKNLRSSLITTDSVISEIDWRLSRNPGNRDVREKQLQGIESALNALPPQERRRPEVRKIIIKAKHRLGDFALSDGLLATAEQKYGEARGELIQIGGRRSVDKQTAVLWALNDSKLGKVALAREQFDEAGRYFGDALKSLEVIARADGDFVRTLATSYLEQADLELKQGHAVEAASYYDEAIKRFELLQGQASDEEEDRYNQSLLAEALGARAVVARRAGDLPRAAKLLERAKDIESPLSEGPSSDAYHRSILARIDIGLAELSYDQRDPHEAVRYFESARDRGRALVDGDRTRKPYAIILCDALRGLQRLAHDREDAKGEEDTRRERLDVVAPFTRQEGEDSRFQDLAHP